MILSSFTFNFIYNERDRWFHHNAVQNDIRKRTKLQRDQHARAEPQYVGGGRGLQPPIHEEKYVSKSTNSGNILKQEVLHRLLRFNLPVVKSNVQLLQEDFLPKPRRLAGDFRRVGLAERSRY